MMQIWSLALQEFTHVAIPLDKQFLYTGELLLAEQLLLLGNPN